MSKSILLLVLLCLTSCGGLKKIALGTTGDLIYDGSFEIETERDWEGLKYGIPANLKLSEALLYLEPEKEELIVTLVKGYMGLAFGVNETLFLEDQLKEEENSRHKDMAITNYSKSIRYGERFLAQKGVTISELQKEMKNEGGIKKYLDRKMGDSLIELEGVLYTAQSLAGLINLQRDKIQLMAILPLAKGLFDWVCGKRPNINFGACTLFYGAYESGRPKMLGGRPEVGKKHFLDAIEKYPKNYLAHALYIQLYLLPRFDEGEYQKLKPALEKALEAFKNESLIWRPNQKEDGPERMRLYQAIGLKRFEIIKKYDKDIF